MVSPSARPLESEAAIRCWCWCSTAVNLRSRPAFRCSRSSGINIQARSGWRSHLSRFREEESEMSPIQIVSSQYTCSFRERGAAGMPGACARAEIVCGVRRGPERILCEHCLRLCSARAHARLWCPECNRRLDAFSLRAALLTKARGMPRVICQVSIVVVVF